ncbi:hypothetical protein ILUMI_24813 [Ignelater luminosus]|uniref:Nose resistant-to-fluoxetine protein N-terminal domain-containing protein n=1 Tax=Ignelater luminosus TaxID=2038154 RepID=A0A8K0FWG2_IGNLU|nr:hypothetical protein ILUMI_24813 [Ignelater luminosus]
MLPSSFPFLHQRSSSDYVEYHPTLNQITRNLLSSVPPLDLSTVEGVSKKCKTHTLQYLRDLKEFKLWALKMYDANAKIPSGFLNGNINQLGDFDLCLAASSDNQNIKGQYCLASFQVEIPQSLYLAALHRLIQSHYAFKSNLEDPGHRVPRFSSINWAVCTPSSCSPKDIELGLREYINKLINGTELEVRFEVNPSMCQQPDSRSLPWSTILVRTPMTQIQRHTYVRQLIPRFEDTSLVANKNRAEPRILDEATQIEVLGQFLGTPTLSLRKACAATGICLESTQKVLKLERLFPILYRYDPDSGDEEPQQVCHRKRGLEFYSNSMIPKQQVTMEQIRLCKESPRSPISRICKNMQQSISETVSSFETIAVDVLNPLPNTDLGHRWVELFPLQAATDATAYAKELLEKVWKPYRAISAKPCKR